MKKITILVLAVTLTVILLLSTMPIAASGPNYHVFKSLDMTSFCVDGQRHQTGKCYCGPSSGLSIGQYYKAEYAYLPSEVRMYDDLWDYMHTNTGLFLGYTNPNYYGPGFVEMALHYGYDQFSYVPYGFDDPVTHDDYWDVKQAIANDWPVAVAAVGMNKGFQGVPALEGSDDGGKWPCTKWHWIAIRGYDYWSNSFGYTWDHHIKCTDSFSGAEELILDWETLVDEVGDELRLVIIKDEGSENDHYVDRFEWGSDGMDLEEYWQSQGGEVHWEVSTSGSSKVEIDTGQHHAGTRSARFYRSSSGPYAWYSLFEPSSISFYLRKNDTAYAGFRLGNGSRAIWVRVNSAERLQYYDTSWHTLSGYVSADYWHRITFSDFKWGTGTFDISVDGVIKKNDAGMRPNYSGYNGLFYIGNWYGGSQSAFWIDDLQDSLR